MAAVAPSADQATNMMQKLSLESQTKTLEIPEPMKKPPVDSGNGMNGQFQSCERSMTPLLQDFMDPAVGYIPNYSGYFLGGYDGAANEWKDYSKYVNPEGVDLSNGAYGDNGAILYQHCYGYAPYGPYSPAGSPVPMLHDGQLYGAQHYQYPFYQPLNATSPPYNPTSAAPVKGDISASAAADQTAPLTVETVSGNPNSILNGGSVKGITGSAPVKPTFQNSTFNSSGSYGRAGEFTPGFQDPRFGFNGGMRSPIPWVDVPLFPDGQPRPVTSTSMVSPLSHRNNTQLSKNQNCQPLFHFMGFHQPRPMSALNSTNGYMNRMYTSNKLYGNDGISFKAGLPFASNGYDSRINGRGWLAVDKYKPRGRSSGFSGGFGNENVEGLNELNRGPRAKNTKNQKLFTPVALAVKGQNIPLSVAVDDERDKSKMIPDREHYNKADFPDNYANAKFYIIKSYSEDDVHKSIKYSVWASTPNGNKKLDAAYQEAQQKSEGCPVFLFFSVNTSGQFVGVAEMVGPVDFHKNFEYWQQDKWSGCFAVKWHIVKDVSNSLLKHITLENNENKPVTNSRDTQEVKLEQGLQMLKIFKEHSSKTCILDDFSFYEGRQKTIQEKKAKQQFQKQIWEGKPTDEKIKGGVDWEVKPEKPLEPPVPDSVKETSTDAVLANGDVKVSENRSVTKAVDASPKGGLKSADGPEKRIVANGVVANAC